MAPACLESDMAKKPSRADRWEAAVTQAQAGLDALKELQDEYQEWYDNLPENLQASATGELLEAIIELDIEGVQDTVDEASGLTLPRGFGRD